MQKAPIEACAKGTDRGTDREVVETVWASTGTPMHVRSAMPSAMPAHISKSVKLAINSYRRCLLGWPRRLGLHLACKLDIEVAVKHFAQHLVAITIWAITI